MPPAEPNKSRAIDRFTFDDVAWTITYQDKTIHLLDSFGLRYIHLLLQKPGKSLAATDMVRTIQRPASNKRQIEESHALDDGLSLHGGEGADDMVDDETIAAAEDRLQNIGDEREAVRQAGDLSRLEELEEEEAKIEAYLKKVHQPDGRRRKLGDHNEKDRKSVSKAIKDAIRKIEEKHSVFGVYLTNSIQTGRSCVYTDSSMDWVL